jgi:hypothetical protein
MASAIIGEAMEPPAPLGHLFRPSFCVALVALAALPAARPQTPAPAPAKSADTQTYRVGLKSIAIPSPSSELSEIGPDYRVVLETLAPATNRLVAAFNRPEDLQQILTGGNGPLPRYALVEIPRRAEFLEVDSATFKTVADSVAKDFGANIEADTKSAQDELNRNLKELSSKSATVAISKPLPLGVLFSKPDAAAFAMVESVSAEGPETRMAVGIVVLRAQHRILFLYLYNTYKDESTVQWISKTSEQWADAILKVNAN